MAPAPHRLFAGDDPQPPGIARERAPAGFVAGRTQPGVARDPPARKQRLRFARRTIENVQNSDLAAAIAASVRGAGASA